MYLFIKLLLTDKNIPHTQTDMLLTETEMLLTETDMLLTDTSMLLTEQKNKTQLFSTHASSGAC